MNILFYKDFFVYKKDKRKSQIRIIIPKRYIKKAVDRNKIRRQIRSIVKEFFIDSCLIKYFDYNIVSFYELRTEIINIINSNNKKINLNDIEK